MKKRLLILLVAACTSVASGQPRTLADTLIVHVIGGFGVGGNQSQLLWLKSNGTYQMLSGDFPALAEKESELGFNLPRRPHPLHGEYVYRDGMLILDPSGTPDVWTFVTDTEARKGGILGGIFVVGRGIYNPRQNVSLRGRVEPGKPLIVGLALGADQWVLIRVIGPGLAQFGVTGVSRGPSATLFSEQRALYDIPAWGRDVRGSWSSSEGAAQMQELFRMLGAFPLTEGSGDRAVLSRLYGGSSHTIVATVESQEDAGEILVEVYYLPFDFTGQRL
jgi:hypothetical protein